jgi:hypothetical protein
MEKYGRARQATDGNKMWHVPFAWWKIKKADTHIFNIYCFPWQHWLCECASVLYDMYIACIVKNIEITLSHK